ncbi:hypothetical protein DTO027I6_10285 [Penicillium roqueforti]|nr:hypothetical protein CBS147337_10419 [Penicillium roqueforti]KAI3180577.1 hypothetical protein DTO027I6_10285 [Penicillium roqueforti]
MLASAYVRASIGGTLEIIDIDNQCAIWSYDNHGCTGSSAFFSQLDGDDCSTLDKVANSTYPGYPMGGAEVCGTANNSSAAWVKVEKTGVVTFFNSQGDTSACRLDRGLKHGSRCTASGLGSSTKSSPTEPSSLTTLKSSSSVSESSSTTFQTTPASNCSAA